MSARVRVVAHVDLDAFYAACEQQRDRSLLGLPLGVAQYDPFEQGGVSNVPPDGQRRSTRGNLIAVSYEARARGVKRGMNAVEAFALCQELVVMQVPTAHGKADLTMYREAGAAVLEVLKRGADTTERASIDEAYFDLTKAAASALRTRSWSELLEMAGGTNIAGVETLPESVLPRSAVRNGYVAAESADAGVLSSAWLAREEELWSEEERHLVAGAALLSSARAAVRSELGYSTSAGVAPNKRLAKLCSGLKKPNAQTLLTSGASPALLRDLPLSRLQGLGGHFGVEVASKLDITTVGQLAAVPFARLDAVFKDKDARWLFALAHGILDEPVKDREIPLSISCSKTFRGSMALRALPQIQKYLQDLAAELHERLADDAARNSRSPRTLTVSISPSGGAPFSRSCPWRRASMADDALGLLKSWAASTPGWEVTGMGLGAHDLEADLAGTRAMTDFFHVDAQPEHVEGAATCQRCGKEVGAADAEEHENFHRLQEMLRMEREEREKQNGANRQPSASKKPRVQGPLDKLLRRG